MPFEHDYDVVIAGGGIAGMALCTALTNAGVRKVKVFEKAQSLRPVGAAIGLFANGLTALRTISPAVLERVNESYIRTEKHTLFDLQGKMVRERQSRITRKGGLLVWYLLQQFLFEAIPDADAVSLGAEVTGFKQDAEKVVVHVNQAGTAKSVTCRILVCADGIRSKLREALGIDVNVRYHGKLMFRSAFALASLREGLCPTAHTQRAFAGDERGKLFVLRETAKGIVTVTAMAPFERPEYAGPSRAERQQRMRQVFANFPAAVHEVIEHMDPLEHPVYDLEHVADRWSAGRVCCIGDTVHAVTPGMGQGANIGLEDAAQLSLLLVPLLAKPRTVDEVSSTLELLCVRRVERLRQIHARSRARTAKTVTSTLSSRVNSYGEKSLDGTTDGFREFVHGWVPFTP